MSDRQILTVAQMQAAEQALMDAGSSVDALMQIAGNGAAEWVWRMAAGRSVTVLCGPGNNGGDGYVIAESLRARGLEVQVLAPMEPATDAAKNARTAFGGPTQSSGKGAKGGVFVDCLFGSGLSRELSPQLVLMIRDLAARHEFSIAVDVPSGVESDSGALLAESMPQYDLTLALGAWKYAHFRLPARMQMGALKLVPIGVDAVDGAAQLIAPPAIAALPADTHKYRRGLGVVIAGAMPGAALLACKAAQHSGAGYIKLLGKIGNCAPWPGLVVEGKDLSETLDDARINALLIGPGLGRGDSAKERLATALQMGIPAVLDADALMLLQPDMLPSKQPVIATPHDGELEQLCRSFSIVAPDRAARAKLFAQQSGMAIIAKGPDTLIASPDGTLLIAPPASNWLSTAGTGDVLAGITLSRLASGEEPIDAAAQAVWLHGEAARQCGAGFAADDLADAVSLAFCAALANSAP